MKKIISILVIVLAFTFNSNAQDKKMKQPVKKIALEQTTGEFTQKSLTVSAYVTTTVKNNSVEPSKETKLTKGEYVYFCPLNPTPQYSLTVE